MEIASILVLVLLWAITIAVYCSAADSIPVHYDGHGNISGYGSKAVLFIIPGIGTGVYFLLTIMNRYPHTFNYLVTLTPENARVQYSMAAGMIRVVKLCVVNLMLIIRILTLPFGGKLMSMRFFLYFVMALVVVTPVLIAWYTNKMVKKDKTKN